MNVLDRILAVFAPRQALRRWQARQALRRWEAAEPSRLRFLRRARGAIDLDVQRAGQSLREQARWLEQNYDLADGALDVLVRNVVGSGIVPEPLVLTRGGELHQDFNLQLVRLWAQWARSPEVTGEWDLASLQRLKARALFRDGEVFAQYLSGPVPGLSHGTAVPFSLELLDADQIDSGYTDPAQRIVQGIRKNAWGRPLTYFRLPAAASVRTPYLEVPAEAMQHLKLAKRIHQTRGVSVFASTLERMEDTRDYDESERMAAKIAAKLTGYIKRGTPDLYGGSTGVGDDGEPAPREIDFAPGMWFDGLQVGEDIGMIDSKRPNPNLGKYRDDMLRAMAAGIGASFSSMARNYEGTYSSRRQEASEQDPHYAMLWGYFVERGERPTWVAWLDAARAAGAIKMPRDLDLSSLYEVDFSRPVQPQIDPQKEAAALELALNTFQIPLVDLWRRAGRNPHDMKAKLRDQTKLLQEIQGAAPRQAPAATPDTGDQAAAKFMAKLLRAITGQTPPNPAEDKGTAS